MAGEAGRLIAGTLAGALLVAAGPASVDPVRALAGRYSKHFENGLVDGTSYWSDDVVEVVPVDARHAYVRVATEFYNGHSCAFSGIARARGESLVYREPKDGPSNGQCTLTLRRVGKDLAFSDGDGSCKDYCGARGGMTGGTLPWASKRAISYLARLKASERYRAAIREWRR